MVRSAYVGHLSGAAGMSSSALLAAAAMDDNVADEGCALDVTANSSDGELAVCVYAVLYKFITPCHFCYYFY